MSQSTYRALHASDDAAREESGNGRASVTRRRVLKGAAIAGAALGTANLPGMAHAQESSPSPVATGGEIDPTVNDPKQTFPLTQEKETLRVLVASRPAVDDYATNEFTAWLEEHTNVHVEWEVLTGTPTEITTALNLRLASGDYPEVMLNVNPGASILQLYGQQGVFIPLNDLIEQHGVFTKRAFEAYPLARTASTATDGNIYSLPQVNDCFHCSMSVKLWVNRNWLEALGLELPTTLDAYAEMLRRFKTDDPNGNGEADELPLSSSPRSWHGQLDHFFMNAFLFHPGDMRRLILRDGQVTPIYTQDAWREGITALAGLFSEGLIDPQAFTQDLDQLRQLGDTDRLGSAPTGAPTQISTYVAGVTTTAQQFTVCPPLEGPNGVRYASYNPYLVAAPGSLMITDKCQNPELAFKWADSLGEIETTTRSIHGVKDRDWRWAHEGEVGINGEPAIWKSITQVAAAPAQNIHWSQTGPTFRSSAYRLGQAVTEEERPTQGEVILFTETEQKYAPLQQSAEMVLPPELYFSEEQAQLVADLSTTIQDYVDQVFAQAVTGQIDIEAEWENYVATLEGMGLPQYLQVHQETYDARPG